MLGKEMKMHGEEGRGRDNRYVPEMSLHSANTHQSLLRLPFRYKGSLSLLDYTVV